MILILIYLIVGSAYGLCAALQSHHRLASRMFDIDPLWLLLDALGMFLLNALLWPLAIYWRGQQ